MFLQGTINFFLKRIEKCVYYTPPYNPKPTQCIVSAGQTVFTLDKKSVVQSLFHKTEVVIVIGFPSNDLCLLTVQQQWCENSKLSMYYFWSMYSYTGQRKGQLRRGCVTMEKFTYLKHKAERTLYCTGKTCCCKRGSFKTWGRLGDLQTGPDKPREKGQRGRRAFTPAWCCLK